jgi:hypothetical protein
VALKSQSGWKSCSFQRLGVCDTATRTALQLASNGSFSSFCFTLAFDLLRGMALNEFGGGGTLALLLFHLLIGRTIAVFLESMAPRLVSKG